MGECCGTTRPIKTKTEPIIINIDLITLSCDHKNNYKNKLGKLLNLNQ